MLHATLRYATNTRQERQPRQQKYKVTTRRNRDVPTPHPHARLRRRRKGAKGDKRYAAACKQHAHTATKNASMLPCRATPPTALPAPPTETGKKEMAFGQGVVVTGSIHTNSIAPSCAGFRQTHVATLPTLCMHPRSLPLTGPKEKRMLVFASSGR